MRRRHTKTFLGLLVVCLFIGTSVVPAFSVNLKERINDIVESKVESFIDERINESYPSIHYSYEDVMNPNLGYDKTREYGEYRERLFDRYDINSYDKLDEYHHEHLEYHRELIEYNDYKPLQRVENSPSDRPDFENGTTWYVDDDGGADFTKIQDAINSSNDGDTVFVYDGVYYENIIINKSIRVIGNDRNETYIDGQNTSADIIWILSNYVEIRNLTILNSGWDGIFIESDNNTIKDNIILHNLDDGIHVKQSKNNQILRNEIYRNAETGILLFQFSDSNSLIKNNIYENKDEGMIVGYYSNHNIILNNTVSKNEGYGICQWNSSECILQDNIVLYNDIGIILFNSINNIVINNDFQSIYLYNSSKNRIESNNLTKIEDFGISLSEMSNNNSIVENIVSNKTYSGIGLVGSSNYNFISGNSVFNNSYHGLNIRDTSFTNISKNNIHHNKPNGIASFNSFKVDIYNNDIYSNRKSGIELYGGSDYNTLTKNKVYYNEDGIIILSSDYNVINMNNCCNNRVDGIGLISTSFWNTVQNNTCKNNLKGIIIERYASSNYIESNFCLDNEQGILINNGFDNEIYNNRFMRNGIGCYLYSSNLNDIISNIISHNNHKGIALRHHSILNNIGHNQLGPWNYQGLYIEKSYINIIHHNNITKNNDDGIGLVQTIGNRIHYNNIFGNTNYAIEGTLCYDNAFLNYWGEEPPKRWIFTNEEDADIYTPGGFVAIHTYRREPVDIAS